MYSCRLPPASRLCCDGHCRAGHSDRNKNLIGSQQTVYCSGNPHQWQRTAVMCNKKSKSEWAADDRIAQKSKPKWTADDWRLIAADRNKNWSGS